MFSRPGGLQGYSENGLDFIGAREGAKKAKQDTQWTTMI